jgi:hypothetical protein
MAVGPEQQIPGFAENDGVEWQRAENDGVVAARRE